MILGRARKCQQLSLLMVTVVLLVGPTARADVVTDWNVKAGEIVVEAVQGAYSANRVLAIVHAAVYEAANAVTRRYPASGLQLEVAPGASLEAAIAAANYTTLTKCAPSQQAAIDAAYHAALALIADGPARTAGLALGEKAAAEVLALRFDDGAMPRGRHTGRTPRRVSTCRRPSRWPPSGRSESRG